jgi:general secretion pathway protein G
MIFSSFRLVALVVSIAGGAFAAGEAPEGKDAVIDATLERAKVKRVEADGHAITAALQMYKINNGAFPTEQQGLKALVEKPVDPPLPKRWIKLMTKVPLDPWDRKYRLVVRKLDGKDAHFIASQGPDPKDAADDIEHPIEKPEPKK